MFTSLTQRFAFDDLPYSVQETLQSIGDVFIIVGLVLKFVTRAETYLGAAVTLAVAALPVWALLAALDLMSNVATCGYGYSCR